MNCKYAETKLDYLGLLFNYFESLELPEELRGHMAKYLTVLISGIYQDIIKKMIIEMLQNQTFDRKINNFIMSQIDLALKNPNYQNIKRFLDLFNKSWMESLNNSITQRNIEALNSIVTNKNKISHGDQSYITLNTIKEYYDDSKLIILKLDLIILG